MQTCPVCHDVRFKIGVRTDLPEPYPQRACCTRCVRKARRCHRDDVVVCQREERDALEYIRRAIAAGQSPE